MAYTAFKPEIWAQFIENELPKALIAADFCHTKYEGEIKGAGSVVNITELGRPTITKTTDGEPITISSFEKVADSKISMPIKKQAYFGVQLDDSDKAQAIQGVYENLMKGGSYAMANQIDADILALASDSQAVKDSATAYHLTSANVLSKIDTAVVTLQQNNVPFNEALELTMTPRAYALYRQAMIGTSTDNPALLAKNIAGQYNQVQIKVSNNVATANAGAEDLMILRTNKAIALERQLVKVETDRLQGGFADIIKGLSLYDCMITKPKEMVVMNVKYTA